jgi:lipopolysaccharide transport system permease protein
LIKKSVQENWTEVISSKNSWFKLNIKEIWEYRDLVRIFVKRDIVSVYKQTILGPVWFFLGPLFTVFTYNYIFKSIAHLSTDGLPGPLFYLAGTTLWNYFQACFSGVSSTFVSNAGIYGKVYFPRLVSPISLVISNLLKFFIQMITFLLFLIYYMWEGAYDIHPNKHIILLPFLIIIMGGIALGGGILVSSISTKYRDLTMLIGVFISLLMYATPIMYPMSAIPEMYKPFLAFNPIAPLIETFRFAFTGSGTFSWFGFLYSFIFMVVILLFGIFMFNKAEKTFMDTV